MMLKKYLSQLKEDLKLGAEDCKEDERGITHLKINSRLLIFIKKEEAGFGCFSALSPLMGGNREDLFIYLMRANFLGQGTGKSVIGLDLDEKFLTLSFILPYEVNYKIFRESLEDFCNFTDYWKEEIHRFATQTRIL